LAVLLTTRKARKVHVLTMAAVKGLFPEYDCCSPVKTAERVAELSMLMDRTVVDPLDLPKKVPGAVRKIHIA
jgi:hypothetical protein